MPRDLPPGADFMFGEMTFSERRAALHAENRRGVRHRLRVTPLDPSPGVPITLWLACGQDVACVGARLWYTVDGSVPTEESARQLDLQPAGAVWDRVTWTYQQQWQVTLPGQPAGTLLRYRLAARAPGNGRWIFADNQADSLAFASRFGLWIADDPAPGWARQAIIYQIFLDRFYPGDGRSWIQTDDIRAHYGGTLDGARQKLDYIRDLGCNAVWLSPLFPSPSAHRYDASDYFSVDPSLGGDGALTRFIDSAHARGIRVIFDFVANHWSNEHPTLQDARHNPHSPYRDWYLWINYPHEYHTFFGVHTMPKLNLDHPALRQHLFDSVRHWLEMGVDGLRLDYALGPSFDFWADFRRACRAVRDDCWLFGEIVASAPEQTAFLNSMDGTCDFLLADMLRRTFALDSADLATFDSFLTSHERYFPAAYPRPSFLDNHDMNRFLYVAGENRDRLRLAALVLYTLSGPPIIYNGTETGVSQERPIHQNDFGIFEEARLPMNWDDPQAGGLSDYFGRLAALRRSHPVIVAGKRRTLHLNVGAGTYAYLRHDTAEALLVVVNNSDQQRTLQLPATGLAAAAYDRLNGCPLQRDGDTIVVTLPPRGGAFIA